MKRLRLAIGCLFLLQVSEAKPRYAFPQTPDEIGQNDRDLDDQIRTGLANATFTDSDLTGGSTNYIQNRDTLQSGAEFHVSSGAVDNLMLIGPSSPRTILSGQHRVQVEGTNSPGSSLTLIRDENGAFGPSVIIGKSRSTTLGGNDVVQNGDELGRIRFFGADGNDMDSEGARISAIVTGDPGSNDLPTSLVIYTTPDASASPSESFRISPAGEITQTRQPSFLVTNSAGATNVTGNGTIYQMVWGNEIFDRGGNIINSTFTASVTGLYKLQVSLLTSGVAAGATSSLANIITSNRTYNISFFGGTGNAAFNGNNHYHGSVLADMDINDTARISLVVNGVGSDTVDIFPSAAYNYFSGKLEN